MPVPRGRRLHRGDTARLPAEKFPGWTPLLLSFVGAIPELFTAVIIVGGVLSGVFTVTESGAFGTIYAFLVTLLVYRSLT